MSNSVRSTKKERRHWTRDDTELTLLALPTTVWYVLFCFLPMFGIIIAFKDFRISGSFISSVFKSSWAGGNGFKNFQSLFSFGDIWTIIRNTLSYNAVFIVLGIVIPVVLALMINQLHSKLAAKLYQTAMFMPYFLSWVVVSAVVFGFLSYDKGLANKIIESIGGQPVQWYMEPKYWPFLIIFMNLWKSVGYGMVVYLASITGIDGTYYEAAVIDGATKWQQTRYITLPLMKTVIVIMFILSVGRIFYSDFGLFYQVPRASNSLFDVTYTIDVYVFSMMKTGTTGMASGAALIQSVVGCITILLANGIVSKFDSDSAMI
ncbi:MAG TPA: ABC transporter permease subunit [Ruminiclostridium sp.]|nr:ABC transporter permease subunit [Ruminiclostridium sp.]